MAYEHTKVDKKLVESPVTETCGNPRDHNGEGAEHGGTAFTGSVPESKGVIDTVTYVDVEGGPKKS